MSRRRTLRLLPALAIVASRAYAQPAPEPTPAPATPAPAPGATAPAPAPAEATPAPQPDSAPPAAEPAQPPATPAAATPEAEPKADASEKKLATLRLDLSIPDVPAFTALGVSPAKVTQPTNVKDLVAAISSGVDASGNLQSGVAIEVAPFQLVDNAIDNGLSSNPKLWKQVLAGLATSFGTNAVAVDGKTNMQAALGVRYAYSFYVPSVDAAIYHEGEYGLVDCIASAIPAPGDPVDPLSDTPPASTDTPQLKNIRKKCREVFKAAHLANSGFQLAYARTGQATDSNKVKDFGTTADSAWFSFSIGFNSFAPNLKTKDTPKLEDLPGKLPDIPKWALGFQPTVMARFDAKKIPMVASRQNDLFVGARLPVMTEQWSFFVEGGYKRVNLGDLAVPASDTKTEVPIGLGGDVRLSDGTWFGLYAGVDAKNGNILSLGNVKWSIGEDRPYAY